MNVPLSNLKAHPVTTLLGTIGGLLTYLSMQPALVNLPSASPDKDQLVALVCGAVVFLFGGFSKDPNSPPSA